MIGKSLHSKFPFLYISKYHAQTIIHNQYNFFVDFKGLLYFDDATPFIYPNCIKDVKFITQLYKNLKSTTTPKVDGEKVYWHYAEFWGELNYVRSAISPVIFNSINNEGKLRYSMGQELEFRPEGLTLDGDGRIWHPFKDDIRGVFSNDLIVWLMDKITTKEGKTILKYCDQQYEIPIV